MSKRNTPNYAGALYSFLRVLGTNVSTALLPLFLSSEGNAGEYPTGKALSIALTASLLLTLINFFRSGETRFGTLPNPGAEPGDRGIAAIGLVGLVLLVVGAILLIIAATHSLLSVPGLILLAIGVVLLLVDREGVRL